MSQRLLNKVAVVTGASRGIGRAIVTRFLQEGAKVAVFARTRSLLDELAETAPARVLPVEGDVTSLSDLSRLQAATTRRFGNVDVVVSNAGVALKVPFAECTAESVQQQFDVNFMGAIHTVRAFLPTFAPGGSILFVTGNVERPGIEGLGLYNASKAAVRALAFSMSSELAPRDIRVNCICPGPLRTGFWEAAGITSARMKQALYKRPKPTDDDGRPEDVAETAVFLCTDASRHIRGQELIVDGGSARS